MIFLKDIKERYEKAFLRNDLICCFVIVSILMILDLTKKVHFFRFISESLSAIYSMTINISVTIFVFLLTSVSIIIAFMQDSKIEKLLCFGHHRTVLKTFFSAIGIFGVLAFLALIGTLNWNAEMKYLLFWLNFLFFLFAFSRLIRTVWVLMNLANLILTLKKPDKLHDDVFRD
jgi:hypothetical protein